MGFVALAALPALGLGAFAAADTGTGATNGQQGTRPPHPALTDTQKQCLVDHGVTLPQRPTGSETGVPPAPPADEQRVASRQAAAACGLPTPASGANRPGLGGPGPGGPGFGGPGGIGPSLTDAQKQCLVDQGVTLPQRPTGSETGVRPAPPTAEQRAALQPAAAACDITIPEHGPRGAGSA